MRLAKRCCAIAAFLIGCVALTSAVQATEYDMRIYVLPEQTLRAAIGSEDAALRDAMQQDAGYIEALRLDRRFPDGALTRAAGQLVAGQEGRASMANGFALELLLRQITPEDGQFQIPLPFAELRVVGDLLDAGGDRVAAGFMYHLSDGVGPGDEGLAKMLGMTEAQASVWPVARAQAPAILAALPDIDRLAETLDAYLFEPDSPRGQRAAGLISEAARRDYIRYGDHGGQGPDPQKTADRVASALDDPYYQIEPVHSLSEDLSVIEDALSAAVARDQLAIFVYRTN